MRWLVDISTFFAVGLASLPNTVLAFPNKNLTSGSSSSSSSSFSSFAPSSLPIQSSSSLTHSPTSTSAASSIVSTTLTFRTSSTATSAQWLQEIHNEGVSETETQASPASKFSSSPTNSPSSTQANTPKAPEANKEHSEHTEAALLSTDRQSSIRSSTSTFSSSLSTSSILSTKTSSRPINSPSPYTTETLVYTTHIGLKPYEIVTTGLPRNQSATYRPPFIGDSEPLSCYPDYLLTETAPKFWGWAEGYSENELVHENECYTSKANGCRDWNAVGCTVRAGEVKLLYFPTPTSEAHGTITAAPATTAYDKFYDFTFTYPSVYILYHRIDGWTDCQGPNKLGPHITSAFFPYNLEEISTLTVENGQLTGKRQLTLSDIMAPECSTITFDVYSAWSNTAPAATDASYRCFPRLSIPKNILEFGKPWWNGCAIYGESTGMIDPPYALTAGAGLGPVAVGPVNSNEEDDPTRSTQVAILHQDQTTHTPFVQPTTAPVPIAMPDPALPTNTRSPPSPPPAPQPDNSGSGNSPIVPDTNTQPANNPSTNSQPAVVNHPVDAVSVSFIATNIIAAPPKGSSIEDKPETVNSPGNPLVSKPTETGSRAQGQNIPDFAVPLNQKTDDSAVDPSRAGNPVPDSVVLNTAAHTPQPPEKVVYKSHTLQKGGPVATVSSLNAVLSYGTNGVIVQYPDGVVSTASIAAGPMASSDPAIQNENPSSPTSQIVSSLFQSASAPSPAPNPVDDSGDMASFIDYVMNGSPVPIPTSTRAPVMNQTTGTGNNSDATDATELFTGHAQKTSRIKLFKLSTLGYALLVLLL